MHMRQQCVYTRLFLLPPPAPGYIQNGGNTIFIAPRARILVVHYDERNNWRWIELEEGDCLTPPTWRRARSRRRRRLAPETRNERQAMSMRLDVVDDAEQTYKRSFTAHCSGDRYLCTSTIEDKSQLPRSALDRSHSPIMRT